jgi:hypothetical protein
VQHRTKTFHFVALKFVGNPEHHISRYYGLMSTEVGRFCLTNNAWPTFQYLHWLIALITAPHSKSWSIAISQSSQNDPCNQKLYPFFISFSNFLCFMSFSFVPRHKLLLHITAKRWKCFVYLNENCAFYIFIFSVNMSTQNKTVHGESSHSTGYPMQMSKY